MVGSVRQGLGQTGYYEGKNVAIEYRWAEGRYDKLPALAAELVARQVAVIAAVGGEPSGLAAKAATTSIPIVCSLGGDAVEAGLVTRLNRPGGNITGVTILGQEMGRSGCSLPINLCPTPAPLQRWSIRIFGWPWPRRAICRSRRGLSVCNSLSWTPSTEAEIDAAFANLGQHKVDVLLVNTDAFLLGQREQVVQLAARYTVAALYFLRQFVDAGGLMSYGSKVANSYRQVGIYVGSILKGEKVSDLPVVQPTKFDLVINLRTARALGLEIPTNLLVAADEVIE
jgi:putative ABC transport system substrate-binding protein